ncbi:hypothetical protein [Mycobacteroides abscessus]|uniref:hypothetical protein n=1 Tax=Mycobacteroides abscessus TaxID=36809 RepID=UPI000944A2C1|nr:hypothetical protein [Mycobacteroides abscessus]
MTDIELPLTPEERLTIVSLYARLTAVTPSSRLRLDSCLTSKDVLHPSQHNAGNGNPQVGQSHILVSHSLSQNLSHGEGV